MELVTQTSLRAAQLVWRPGHGGFVLTVVCKATYALRPGTSPLAPTQQPITTADVYADGGALLAASDLVPFKKQPEALLTGHAYAPQGKRVTSFVARFSVGEMDKAVQVVGDRTFGLDGRLSEPAPFTRMPLSWDRAFGGPETVNPAGRALGAAAKPDAYGRALAPNLMPPDTDLASRADNVAVMGFGPIAPHWPSRARCLHRHAQGWDPSRWNERPLPADIDLAYFNAAPPDQWRSTPFVDEPIVLSNLHPLFGTLSTRLAAISPSAIVERDQGSEPLQLRCDTLLVDSDRGLAMLVWRGHVVLDHPDRPGRILVSHQEAKSASAPAPAPVFDSTQADFAARSSSTMPFADIGSDSAASAPSAVPAAPAASSGLLSGETVSVDAMFGSTMALGFAAAAPALPFPKSEEARPPASDPLPIDFDAYPPSRCGALAARLECNESATADLLRSEDLDADRWEQIHDHWLDRIDADTSRGRVESLAEYDHGYVKGLEVERGPVTAQIYARLAAAMERDTLEEVLAELRFPEDAWLHLHRAFIARMIRDPKLGKEVRLATAAEKKAP